MNWKPVNLDQTRCNVIPWTSFKQMCEMYFAHSIDAPQIRAVSLRIIIIGLIADACKLANIVLQ